MNLVKIILKSKKDQIEENFNLQRSSNANALKIFLKIVNDADYTTDMLESRVKNTFLSIRRKIQAGI